MLVQSEQFFYIFTIYKWVVYMYVYSLKHDSPGAEVYIMHKIHFVEVKTQ